MECPKCGHEPTMKELQESPESCTQCGVNYAKYHQIQEREAQSRAQDRAAAASLAKAAPAVRAAMADYPGAQPVVVIDLKMGFWSMVVFMVKWAFASIPALLIIASVLFGLSILWSALLGFPGMGKVPAAAALNSSVTGEPKLNEYIDLPSEPSVAYFLLDLKKNGTAPVELYLKKNSPVGVTYRRVSIDCAARTISLDVEANSYAELYVSSRSGEMHHPAIGTTDDFLVSRACR